MIRNNKILHKIIIKPAVDFFANVKTTTCPFISLKTHYENVSADESVTKRAFH
jgi:hypothetical protein